MIDSLFRVLEAGFTLWNTDKKQKYVDELMSLKKDWYEESNKPLASRSDAVLDGIELKLRILADAFSSGVTKPNA